MKSLSRKGKRQTFCLNIFYSLKFFNYSENIERYRKIIQQRIVAVKEEASRKYGNLIESIPSRLEQIIKKPEVEEVNEEEANEPEEKEN
jgi:hypothetical protein